MTTISTPRYLLDQAKRRFTPTMNTIPGMGLIEKRLMNVDWPQHTLAEPPAGSDLKPIMGDSGLPLLGHIVEMFRLGPDFPLHLYNTRGPITFADSPILPSIVALGPEATQTIFVNKNKDFSQKGWLPVIGPFFNRGLMMLEFDEHMAHRRIMQSAFTRPRLASYVEDIDRVATAIVADWPTDDGRFLVYPAMKELTLDVASVVFMGHEPGSDHQLVTKVNRAFEQTTRAGGAIIRTGVPPFKWWQGLQGRKLLEDYFTERVKERRKVEGTDMLTVLCHTSDEDGNSFSDADIVNHMIFLMMAAHDTTTSTVTTMIYHLAAHQDWQDRARDESQRLGDSPLDIESLEKLETLDLVMDESLRLVTPLPFNMRQAVRDTDLLGHFVPAGTNIVTWPGMNHWLPELYTNPRQFDPERFLEPRSEHKQHRYAWAPFGGGAHKCIGMVFGRLEIKTVLHRLLRQYRIELAHPGYQPRWDYGGMPIPMDGMPITLRRL
ncbi:cytochrome P450 [Mycolicibacter minnesotensis]|uniref:Cytochrome P450 n=1 Tax=Mycolicibacter minnesotensis TaxID=1118379 RepID=A0A7I7R248_9MYCO|nr:cytochrome P450 [Mycolicibacter minnesotensis]ORB02161.1 cytochrome P450 [Mycolicibacter minnesotensis]BBY32452.1 cytochrome P450 [Mycolicibacter minnesotensis]